MKTMLLATLFVLTVLAAAALAGTGFTALMHLVGIVR